MPAEQHDSFPQPADPSILAWRYLDTAKLLSLLLHRQLYLRRVDLLPDKFEGTHPKLTKGLAIHALTSAPPLGGGLDLATAQKIVGLSIDNSKVIRKTAYASCWRLGNHESEAMWRLYCGTAQGAALVIPYSQLQTSLHDPLGRPVYLGQITYVDFDKEVFGLENLFKLIMHKRKEYEHEHEARVVIWNPPPAADWLTATMPESLSFPWDPELHLQKIVISPYSEPWYVDTIRALVGQICPSLVSKVRTSSMGDGPYS